MCLKYQFPRSELPLIELVRAYDKARDGDYDNALPQMLRCVDELSLQHQFSYQIGATPLLVESLIGRAAPGDLAEAEAAVDRLAAIPGDEWVARDIMVLRLRTMLAQAAATKPATKTFGTATVLWPHRWASRGTCSGPRRCSRERARRLRPKRWASRRRHA
jgi:hypothetical protein